MKVMCVFEGWQPDVHPQIGDICHVSFVYYRPDGSVGAYDLQEFPCPHPFRWGAWYKGPGGRLCPTFIEVETEEAEESSVTVEELMDELVGDFVGSSLLFG